MFNKTKLQLIKSSSSAVGIYYKKNDVTRTNLILDFEVITT